MLFRSGGLPVPHLELEGLANVDDVTDGDGPRVRVRAEETIDAARLLRIWKSLIVLHADGTPRTKHVTTNPIIEVDEEAGTASCRSYYTVLQQTDKSPLQTIVTGRYHDRFERVDGRWRFSYRDLTLIDMVGDVSHHLTYPITPA